MGIFIKRGIEYLVILENFDEKVFDALKTFLNDFVPNTHITFIPQFNAIVVVGQDVTDKLLPQTDYYHDNQASWFEYGYEFVKPIDIELGLNKTQQDIIKLTDKFLASHDGKVKSIGWHDVNYIQTTY